VEKNAIEKLLWSVALPGFGQFLNGRYFKGTILLILEFLINVQANFNEVIILSFQGDIQKAIEQTDYGWLMFIPACISLRCGMLGKMLVEEKIVIHFFRSYFLLTLLPQD
jgi:TM2 domain-containing membrane protein YozV